MHIDLMKIVQQLMNQQWPRIKRRWWLKLTNVGRDLMYSDDLFSLIWDIVLFSTFQINRRATKKALPFAENKIVSAHLYANHRSPVWDRMEFQEENVFLTINARYLLPKANWKNKRNTPWKLQTHCSSIKLVNITLEP